MCFHTFCQFPPPPTTTPPYPIPTHTHTLNVSVDVFLHFVMLVWLHLCVIRRIYSAYLCPVCFGCFSNQISHWWSIKSIHQSINPSSNAWIFTWWRNGSSWLYLERFCTFRPSEKEARVPSQDTPACKTLDTVYYCSGYKKPQRNGVLKPDREMKCTQSWLTVIINHCEYKGNVWHLRPKTCSTISQRDWMHRQDWVQQVIDGFYSISRTSIASIEIWALFGGQEMCLSENPWNSLSSYLASKVLTVKWHLIRNSGFRSVNYLLDKMSSWLFNKDVINIQLIKNLF